MVQSNIEIPLSGGESLIPKKTSKRPSIQINRRDFLGVAGAVAAGAILAEISPVLSQAGEGSKAYGKQEVASFFQEKGYKLETDRIFALNKEVEIFNATNLKVDAKHLTELFLYFENYDRRPFKYNLTDSSKAVSVSLNRKPWQGKGSIFFVPMDSDLPEQYTHLRKNDAFTDYREDGGEFITIIRVPSEEYAQKTYGINRSQYAQLSMTVEAAQSSFFVQINGDYGIGFPPNENRFLTQEAVGNTFWYVAYDRLHNFTYSPLLLANTTTPSNPTSDGKSYALRAITISEDQYYGMPRSPILAGLTPR